MIGADHRVAVSFVHGFHDGVSVDETAPRPALWTIDERGERTARCRFPITADDFARLPYPLLGEPPAPDAPPPSRRPRYGFTGLCRVNGHLLAGAWNGVYRLDAETLEVEAFLSNRSTCYLHRFHADAERIVFANPFMDMTVIMAHDGTVLDRFTVDRGLNVSRRLPDPDADWRFVGKPWSGPTGFFHFNSVQVIDGEIYLTSRNLGAFVVVRPGADRATLRTLNYHTTSCVHDGDHFDDRFYLTSIDGKILVASEPEGYDPTRFRYDLQVDCLRLGDVEHNWCRGMAVTERFLYTTIDGRYGSDLSFGVLQLDREGHRLDQRRFQWRNVGDERDIRYVTGFDIVVQ